MPGYGAKMERFTPEPTKETPELEERFLIPKVRIPTMTIVQMVILGLVVMYAFSARKMNKVGVSTAVFAVALLHMYDHMYRVKRGDEHLFFLPKKEGYCGACRK